MQMLSDQSRCCQQRMFNATEEEMEAAIQAVAIALRHPKLRRAATVGEKNYPARNARKRPIAHHRYSAEYVLLVIGQWTWRCTPACGALA